MQDNQHEARVSLAIIMTVVQVGDWIDLGGALCVFHCYKCWSIIMTVSVYDTIMIGGCIYSLFLELFGCTSWVRPGGLAWFVLCSVLWCWGWCSGWCVAV